MIDQLMSEATWLLFRKTAKLTGKFLGRGIPSKHLKVLMDSGYATPVENGVLGRVYGITDAGVKAIREIHHRDVWAKKFNTDEGDPFTDGLISPNKDDHS